MKDNPTSKKFYNYFIIWALNTLLAWTKLMTKMDWLSILMAYWDLVKEGENGFGFEPTNSEELKAIMLKFINREVDIKKMGEKSKEIIKDYTPENAVMRMLNAVKKVLGEKT
jgi:hypothetical protein